MQVQCIRQGCGGTVALWLGYWIPDQAVQVPAVAGVIVLCSSTQDE